MGRERTTGSGVETELAKSPGVEVHGKSLRIVFMHRGRMAEHTPADQFFDAPASVEARAYLNGELRW